MKKKEALEDLRGHKLLTEELEKRFAEVGRQDGKLADALVIARYYTPLSDWVWFVTELHKDEEGTLLFGFVCGLEQEWGYFSPEELAAARGVFGPWVHRDLRFREKTVRKALEADGRKVPDWMNKKEASE